jgi:hypothetical protein
LQRNARKGLEEVAKANPGTTTFNFAVVHHRLCQPYSFFYSISYNKKSLSINYLKKQGINYPYEVKEI